jgi:hypothetical protein
MQAAPPLPPEVPPEGEGEGEGEGEAAGAVEGGSTEDTEARPASHSVLERSLTALIRQVVNGIPGVASQGPVVDAAQKLLDKCDGDVEAAVQRVREMADTAWGDTCFRFLAALVPLGGMAVRLESLWVQMRAVALVAALYGHNVSDSVVCYRMLLCLVDARVSPRGIERRARLSSDPLAQGAQAVVSDVANRVSGGGAVSMLVDSLTGRSIDATVARAREHFRPQNAFSYLWLGALLTACVLTRVVRPLSAALSALLDMADSSLQPGAQLSLVQQLMVRYVPMGTSVAALTVVFYFLLFAAVVSSTLGWLLLRAVRASPSTFSFVIMCVPPLVQATLARSAALVRRHPRRPPSFPVERNQRPLLRGD